MGIGDWTGSQGVSNQSINRFDQVGDGNIPPSSVLAKAWDESAPLELLSYLANHATGRLTLPDLGHFLRGQYNPSWELGGDDLCGSEGRELHALGKEKAPWTCHRALVLVPLHRFELWTYRLRSGCSTN